MGKRLSSIGTRPLLIGLTTVGLVPVVLGFIFDVGGFLAHVLAGLSGLILGAVLAVVLIEQLLRRRRREQWSVARYEMSSAICEGLVDMASSFAIVVPSGNRFLGLVGPEDDPSARPQIAAALRELGDAMRDELATMASSLDPDLASSRTMYDQAALALGPLRGATTRVIVLGDEPQLVKRMLAFERAEQRWIMWIETVEQAGAPDRIAWEQAVIAVKAAAEIYQYFVVPDERTGSPLSHLRATLQQFALGAAVVCHRPVFGNPWDSEVDMLTCYAAVSIIDPLLLWCGGELTRSIFGLGSRWRLSLFMSGALIDVVGVMTFIGRERATALGNVLSIIAWLLLGLIVVPVLGLVLPAGVAFASYLTLLVVALTYALRFGRWDITTLPKVSWVVTWSILALFFAFSAYRLILFQ